MFEEHTLQLQIVHVNVSRYHTSYGHCHLETQIDWLHFKSWHFKLIVTSGCTYLTPCFRQGKTACKPAGRFWWHINEPHIVTPIRVNVDLFPNCVVNFTKAGSLFCECFFLTMWLTITHRNTSNTGSHQHLLNGWMHGFIKRLSYVAFPVYFSRKREISQEMPGALSNLLQIRELVSERTGIHTQVFSVATPRGNQAGSSVIFLNICPETWPWSRKREKTTPSLQCLWK